MGAKRCECPSTSIEIVSIHAPVMGANWLTSMPALAATVSIHAPVMGAKVADAKAAVKDWFQSTHP